MSELMDIESPACGLKTKQLKNKTQEEGGTGNHMPPKTYRECPLRETSSYAYEAS